VFLIQHRDCARGIDVGGSLRASLEAAGGFFGLQLGLPAVVLRLHSHSLSTPIWMMECFK